MGFIYRHIRTRLIAGLTTLVLSAGAAYSQVPESPDTLTIRILGDIMMHTKQIEAAKRSDGTYDFDSYFKFIQDRISGADIAIANMEFTLAGEPYSGYPCFSAPDDFENYLAECGFDVFLAANNHIFDKGTKGAVRTLEKYRRLGIKFTGIAGDEKEMAGNTPLFIEADGISLALVNFTYGTNVGLSSAWPKTNYESERTRLTQALSKAQEADFVIALPHWGTEYVLKHSAKQRETAQWLVKSGADIVIGAHPHVVQDKETIEGVTVVYSLGNAVSNMSATNTQLELIATLRLVRKADGDIEALPLELEYLWCSRPGGYDNTYTVIPVKEFMDRKDEWGNPADHWKMVDTYNRVSKETNIY